MGFSKDGFVLALLKSTDGSVLALLRLPSIFSCKNSTVGEFWCIMAIKKEKQQNFLFEIECIFRCFVTIYPLLQFTHFFEYIFYCSNLVCVKLAVFLNVCQLQTYELAPNLLDPSNPDINLQLC